MIGIDTLSLGKIFYLLETPWKPLIEEIIRKIDIFITSEVKKELLHRYKKFFPYIQQFKIFPTRNISLQSYLDKEFDSADASLLEYSELLGHIIITEDNEMLLEGISDKNNIIQLVDFLFKLHVEKFITKREMYHLIKYLRKTRNITKRKEKKLLKQVYS
jgi:hypothetical protein